MYLNSLSKLFEMMFGESGSEKLLLRINTPHPHPYPHLSLWVVVWEDSIVPILKMRKLSLGKSHTAVLPEPSLDSSSQKHPPSLPHCLLYQLADPKRSNDSFISCSVIPTG